MQAHLDTNQRLQELIAKIEIEQNPRMFSGLVEELNGLLESDRSAKKPPTAWIHQNAFQKLRLSKPTLTSRPRGHKLSSLLKSWNCKWRRSLIRIVSTSTFRGR